MDSERETTLRFDPAFDVDGMLGRLAKWLRILGYDTAFPCKGPGKGRIFVTAACVKRHPEAVYVTSGSVFTQLKEVQEQTGISFDRSRVLSRCLACNEPVLNLPSDRAVGRVPDQILDRVQTFHHCLGCGKVFWEGSHRSRIETRLADAGIGFFGEGE